MASDSAVVAGSCSSGSVVKLFRIGSSVFGVAGVLAIAIQFLEWKSGRADSPPTIGEGDDFGAIEVCGDGKIYCYDSTLVRLLHNPDYYAEGSGSSFALGAMAYGATAREAVKAAIKHDVYSGGRIQTMRYIK